MDLLVTVNNNSEDETIESVQAASSVVVNAIVRGKNKIYEKIGSFDTKEEAVKLIDSQKIWGPIRTNTSKQGIKIFCRCNLAPCKGKQCCASAYIFMPSNAMIFEVYQTTC